MGTDTWRVSSNNKKIEGEAKRGDRMQVGSICINLHFNHFYVGLVKLPGPVHYTTLFYLTLSHPVLLFPI